MGTPAGHGEVWLVAGATSHPDCGPSWLVPPHQAQQEGEGRAEGPGWGGQDRQDPVLLQNSSLELMLERSSRRKRAPEEFPLGTRLSQELPASASGFPPSSWAPLLCGGRGNPREAGLWLGAGVGEQPSAELRAGSTQVSGRGTQAPPSKWGALRLTPAGPSAAAGHLQPLRPQLDVPSPVGPT